MTNVKAAEPSIEEILASIRKIISDDDESAAPDASATASAPKIEPEPEEDVLELTDIVVETPPAAPHEEPAPQPEQQTPAPLSQDKATDTAWDEALSEQKTAPKIEEARMPADDQGDDNEHIVSESTFAAAAGALSRLAQSESSSSGGGRSIEDITRDLLRPMLKAWLDQNLPALVEKLVERELKKISRKAEDI